MKSFRKQFKIISLVIAAVVSISFLLLIGYKEIKNIRVENKLTEELSFDIYRRLLIEETKMTAYMLKYKQEQFRNIVASRLNEEFEKIDIIVNKFYSGDKQALFKALVSLAKTFGQNESCIIISKNGEIYKESTSSCRNIKDLDIYRIVLKQSYKNNKFISSYVSKTGSKHWILVKYYKRHQIYVAVDLNIDSLIKSEQEQVLQRLSRSVFGKYGDGYVFIIDHNNKFILKDHKMNQKKIDGELLKKIQSFVRSPNQSIVIHREENGERRILCIVKDPKWQWLVGVSQSEKDLNSYLTSIREHYHRRLIFGISSVALLALFVFIMIFEIINSFIKKVYKDYSKFTSSFSDAIENGTIMKSQGLVYLEHYKMTEDINSMLRAKFAAESKLIDNTKKLKTVLETIKESLFVVEEDGTVSYCNKAARSLFPIDNIVGSKVKDIFLKNKLFVDLKSLLKKSSSTEINYKNRILLVKTYTLFESEKNPEFIILIRDVTQEKERTRREERIRKLDSLGVLAAGIAHDFNNIMSAVYGNIELAKYKLGSDNSQVKEFLEVAASSMDKAKRLSQQLLTFSRGGSPIFGVVETGNLIKSVVDFVLSGSNIKAHYDIKPDIMNVTADQGQISEVITNIVVNAKQAMPQGGNIYIKAKNVKDPVIFNFKKTKGKYVELSIRDEGSGIPAEHINNIFDPYFTTKKTGTGLGLSIVHSIIKKHNGYITVESIPGKGTEFKIYLPATTEKVESMNNNGNNHISKQKILVIDDEESVRNVLKSMIEICGHEVETACNPQKGLSIFTEAFKNGQKFDIVIIDLTMPGYPEGDKVIKDFIKVDKNIKTIACSGYSDGQVMTNYKSFGFNGRLEKPFNFRRVKEEIVAVVTEE